MASYDLRWNEDAPPGEAALGRFDCAAPPDVVARVEAEWAAGHAVWLFMFNADARLCFEEVLVPATGGPSAT